MLFGILASLSSLCLICGYIRASSPIPAVRLATAQEDDLARTRREELVEEEIRQRGPMHPLYQQSIARAERIQARKKYEELRRNDVRSEAQIRPSCLHRHARRHVSAGDVPRNSPSAGKSLGRSFSLPNPFRRSAKKDGIKTATSSAEACVKKAPYLTPAERYNQEIQSRDVTEAQETVIEAQDEQAIIRAGPILIPIPFALRSSSVRSPLVYDSRPGIAGHRPSTRRPLVWQDEREERTLGMNGFDEIVYTPANIDSWRSSVVFDPDEDPLGPEVREEPFRLDQEALYHINLFQEAQRRRQSKPAEVSRVVLPGEDFRQIPIPSHLLSPSCSSESVIDWVFSDLDLSTKRTTPITSQASSVTLRSSNPSPRKLNLRGKTLEGATDDKLERAEVFSKEAA